MLTPFRAATAIAVLAAAGVLACVASPPNAQAPAPGAPPVSSERVVATIDGEKITEAELDRAVGAELGRLEQQIYDLRQRRLDAMIGERLVAREAAKRKVSVDALLKDEVDARLGAITDEDVTRFYEANKARLPNSPNIRDQIKQYLEMQRGEDAQRRVRRPRCAPPPPLPSRWRRRPCGAPRSPSAIPPFAATRGPPSPSSSSPISTARSAGPCSPRCWRCWTATLARCGWSTRTCRSTASTRTRGRRARRRGAPTTRASSGSIHDALYSGAAGTDVSPDTLNKLATQAGLDLATFKQCLDSDRHMAGIQRDIEQAERLGLSGTPAFFVNGRLLTGRSRSKASPRSSTRNWQRRSRGPRGSPAAHRLSARRLSGASVRWPPVVAPRLPLDVRGRGLQNPRLPRV